jgi:hypothetical protein
MFVNATPIGAAVNSIKDFRAGNNVSGFLNLASVVFDVAAIRGAVGVSRVASSGGSIERGMVNSRTFYSVQSAEDATRLRNGGTPWPTAPNRAALGQGVYAWDNPSSATTYQNHLLNNRNASTEIVSFSISDSNWEKLSKFSVDLYTNPDAWLDSYSVLRGGTPTYEYNMITRGTNFGTEYYFNSNIHSQLNYKP